jgi:hypothetical protein
VVAERRLMSGDPMLVHRVDDVHGGRAGVRDVGGDAGDPAERRIAHALEQTQLRDRVRTSLDGKLTGAHGPSMASSCGS